MQLFFFLYSKKTNYKPIIFVHVRYMYDDRICTLCKKNTNLLLIIRICDIFFAHFVCMYVYIWFIYMIDFVFFYLPI